MTDSNFYDCSGSCFVGVVTQFNAENAYTCLRYAGITERMEKLSLKVDRLVFDSLAIRGELNFQRHDGLVTWHGIPLTEFSQSENLGRGVCDSTFTDSRGKTAVLRTREY